MKAPNLIWSSLFFVIVLIAELIFGHETVASWGAGVAALLAAAVKLWQEYQAQGQAVHTAGTRSVGSSGTGFWRRVLTQ